MPKDEAAEQPAYSHLQLDATAVKVLAHPLRSRLLSALRRGGPASATRLATQLQTNTGATSYHLRKLEEVGLVADTGQGRGKERIWKAATDAHGWTNSSFADDEDARTALGWLVRRYHRDFDQRYTAWLDVAESWPARWQDASGMSDTWVEVTAEQAIRMFAEIDAVIEKYRHAGAGQPDARLLHTYRIGFPLDPAEPPDEAAR